MQTQLRGKGKFPRSTDHATPASLGKETMSPTNPVKSLRRAFAESAEHRLGEDALYELWLKLNAGLREMGVRTLPMPEKLAK